MDRSSRDFDPSRRRLLKQAGAVVLPLALPACGGGGGPSSQTQPADPPAAEPAPPPPGTAPAITSQPASSQVRVGEPATFTVAADGTAPLTYQWLRDGVAITGATGSSFTLASATAGDDGARFSVRVSNGFGSVESEAALLSVLPPALTVDSTTITVDSTSITVDAT